MSRALQDLLAIKEEKNFTTSTKWKILLSTLRHFCTSQERSDYLFFAVEFNIFELVQEIIKINDALFESKDKKDISKSREIFWNNEYPTNISIMHHAAFHSNQKIIKYLYSIDPNLIFISDDTGKIPLYYAALSGNVEANEFLANPKYYPKECSIIKGIELINNGLGYSALMWAAITGKTSIVKSLIELGAKVNVCFFEGGDTPLHFAAYLENLTMWQELRKAGADPYCMNYAGEKPISLWNKEEADNIDDMGFEITHEITLRGVCANE